MPVHEEVFVLSPETDQRLQATLAHISAVFPAGQIVGVERKLENGVAMCVIKIRI